MQVYYFQMYLALVLLGFLHGLIFLPVSLLKYVMKADRVFNYSINFQLITCNIAKTCKLHTADMICLQVVLSMFGPPSRRVLVERKEDNKSAASPSL